MQVWGAGDFAYLSTYRGESLKFVQRDTRRIRVPAQEVRDAMVV